MKAYYHARASEYDDWWLGRTRLRDPQRLQWARERDELLRAIRRLPPARTLDIACGTGFVTQHLPGEVVGVDASEAMVAIARARVPDGTFVVADALELPLADGSFERVFTSHFYGHLEEPARLRFLAEARRVGGELVVADAALHGGEERAERQLRALKDGSRWDVFKRYFTPETLLRETGCSRVLHAGEWFLLVAA